MREARPPVRARDLPSPSPRARGFRWPAEWERHEGTWLAWPHDPQTWPGCVEQAEDAFAALAAAVSRGETVHLLVKDAATEARARRRLTAAGARRVRLHRVRTADSWYRDYGPIVVAKGRGRTRTRLAIDFRFNAWGGKYPTLQRDDDIPWRTRRILGLPVTRTPLVLEGGSIEGNGRGTLLTTTQCLLHANRNPHLTREEVEQRLREWLGVTHVLWLGEGIVGDDTDGHVDDLTRFVNPTTVVTAVEDDPRDENHAVLQENLRRLRAMADQDGRPLTVLTLPMPGRVTADDGRRLPASYANFYVANACVAVPVFGHANDARALKVLRRCFPRRTVVPIRCERLVEGMGTLHCVTQQIPA
jgi:agmatine deiminase